MLCRVIVDIGQALNADRLAFLHPGWAILKGNGNRLMSPATVRVPSGARTGIIQCIEGAGRLYTLFKGPGSQTVITLVTTFINIILLSIFSNVFKQNLKMHRSGCECF